MTHSIELTKKQIQVEQLTQFAQELKENGFTVLVSEKHPFEWLHYEKGGHFGTVGPDHYFNFNFGTVNKPSKEHGTGFSTDREVELTLEYANKSLVTPLWANGMKVAAYDYKSVNEFINYTGNKWANYYIL